MSKNQNKTISASATGIVISFADANKHQFMNYENSYVKKVQLEGTVKYQEIESQPKFSIKQKELYSKVLYGFKAYTKEEIETMTERKKSNVTILYAKVQRLLSNWKQDLTYNFIDSLLLNIFPNSPVVKQMANTSGRLHEISKEDDISLKDLGITQTMIINKLIENNLLPTDFYQLT